MVVCQFFLQGRCKYGDRCRNVHPGNQRQASQNSFAPLSSNFSADGRARSGGIGGRDRYRPGGHDQNQKLPFHLDREAVTTDLTDGTAKGEKPEWLLSAYGPGRDAPRQLLEGVLEQSPEEMRVLCYLSVKENKLQDYLQHESSLKAQAQQQAQTILNDLDSALKYVVDGEHQHPNRNDQVVKGSGAFQPQHATGGFGQPSGIGSGTSGGGFARPSSLGSGSPFGQPSGLGQQTPAFGAPSQPAVGSGFGQPSDLGGRPAFGQASQPGASPAFGAPSQPGNTGNAFGSASALGGQRPAFGQASQPAFGQSGFGQARKPAFGTPSQPASASPFGSGQQQQQQPTPNPFSATASQPSGFGQFGQNQPQQASPFAAAGTTNGQANGFGGPSSQNTTNTFAPKPAAPAFGAPSQPDGTAFPQASQAGTGGFGQPSTTTAPSTAFGQTSITAAPSTAFGQFSAPAAPSTGFGFGSPSQPPAATNGTSAGFGQTNSTASAPSPQPNGTTVPDIPGRTSYATRGPDGKSLSTWKGHPVTYDREQTPWAPYYQNPQTKEQERIWHPDGVPDRPIPYAEAEPEIYLGDLGALLKEVYAYVREKEDFKDVVPEVPPKREWVRWDL